MRCFWFVPDLNSKSYAESKYFVEIFAKFIASLNKTIIGSIVQVYSLNTTENQFSCQFVDYTDFITFGLNSINFFMIPKNYFLIAFFTLLMLIYCVNVGLCF